MPSIRPSYQSLISVFQQGGLLLRGRGRGGGAGGERRGERPRAGVLLSDVPEANWITRNGGPSHGSAPAAAISRSVHCTSCPGERPGTSLAARLEGREAPLRVCKASRSAGTVGRPVLASDGDAGPQARRAGRPSSPRPRCSSSPSSSATAPRTGGSSGSARWRCSRRRRSLARRPAARAPRGRGRRLRPARGARPPGSG